jgi:hypothetical protein
VADQIVDLQVAVLQPPPKVNDSPVFTVTHWQCATAGLVGSISHSTSRQFAHVTPDGQVITPKLALTFTVENSDLTVLPDCARSVQGLNPTE